MNSALSGPSSRDRPWMVAVLIGILAVGLFLRTLAVASQPLWADEALTLLIAQWPLDQLFFVPVDPSPGIYYALVKAIVPAQATVPEVRLMPVIFGSAAIAMMCLISRRALPRSNGLLAASLMALSLPMIDYSQEGRPYALLILLVLTSAFALLSWLEGVRAGRLRLIALVGFAATLLLSFYTHFTSVFWILPAVIAGLELTDRFGPSRARTQYIAAMAITAALAVPEGLRIFSRAGHFGGFGFLANQSLASMGAMLGDLLLPAGYWNGPGGSGTAMSAVALMVVLGVIVYRLYRHRSRVREAVTLEGAAIILILLSAPLVIWAFGFVLTPIFMGRTILLAVPGFALLLALLDSVERIKWFGPALIVAYAGSLFFSGTMRMREPWQPVVEALRPALALGEPIIVCPDWRAPALRQAIGPISRSDLYVVEERGVAVITPAMSGSDWHRHYFDTLLRPEVDRAMGRGQPVRLAGTATPGRMWLVSSECNPNQARILRRWLGPGSRTPVRTTASPTVAVDRVDVAPRVRPVIVPQR